MYVSLNFDVCVICVTNGLFWSLYQLRCWCLCCKLGAAWVLFVSCSVVDGKIMVAYNTACFIKFYCIFIGIHMGLR